MDLTPCMGHSLKKSDLMSLVGHIQLILFCEICEMLCGKNDTFTALKTGYGGFHSWGRWGTQLVC